MKREFLKELGLEAEVIDKIMDENGKDINKAKADLSDVKQQLETANKTIKDRDTQLEELKKVDAQALQDEITKLQNANKEQAEKHEAEMKDFKLTSAIKASITNAQDIDLVTGLIDKSKLLISDDGKVTGLDEQIKALQESKGFLFKETQTSGFTPTQGNKPPMTGDEAMAQQINSILGLGKGE